MSLTHLTNQEMVKLTKDLLRTGGKEREAIDAIAPAEALVPTIERALGTLIDSQAPSGTEIEKLTLLLASADARHDDLVRAIDGRLESEAFATTTAEVREALERVRGHVFATGRGIIQRSYMVEAGEVVLRARRVTDEDREVLRTLKTYEGRTLEDLFDELQASGTNIGALEKRRQELGAEGELVVKNRTARFQWMRAINALAAVLASEGIDEAAILGAIRDAAAKAERRGPSGGGTDVADPNLDPPVPTDDPSGPTEPS